MADRTTGTREEWLAARLELLAADKELTRRSLEPAVDDREDVVRLHPLGVNYGRIDLWAAGGEDSNDRCHPVGRR